MKKLALTISIITLMSSSIAFAEEGKEHSHSSHSHEHTEHNHVDNAGNPSPIKAPQPETSCTDTISVKVNGLVCDFCARALEKIFSKQKDVKDIQVNLDKGRVVIQMMPGKTIDEKTLTKLITDSGYNVENISQGCKS